MQNLRKNCCSKLNLPPNPLFPNSPMLPVQPGRAAQSVGHLTHKSGVRGPGFDTRFGNILSFLLPLFQEGQLSVTGESMWTKYWLTA